LLGAGSYYVYILVLDDLLSAFISKDQIAIASASMLVAYSDSAFDPVELDSGGDDALMWTDADTEITSAIYGITYGDGTFIAMGDSGKAAYSTDGATWTAVSNTTFGGNFTIYGITFGDGTFVLVGNNGRAATSTDGGNTWTAVANTQFGSSTIRGIAYGGTTGSERLVAVGDTGKAACSVNQE
jgi:hypothetical protein